MSTGRPWTDAEDDIIAANTRVDATALVVLLFQAGFRRTYNAVSKRRALIAPFVPPAPKEGKKTRARTLADLELNPSPPAISAQVWEADRDTGTIRKLGPHASARHVAERTPSLRQLAPTTVVCGRGHIWPLIRFPERRVTA